MRRLLYIIGFIKLVHVAADLYIAAWEWHWERVERRET
jgi:hypothetical protein